MLILTRTCSQINSSPGCTIYPPVQISTAESTNADLNGGQASSEQAQRQFFIPGGPANVSFPPMGQFHFLPSQTPVAPVNCGEGLGNDPNIPSFQVEAQRKFLQYQIEVPFHPFFLYLRTSGMIVPGFI